MSELQAEIYPERVELEIVDSEPRIRALAVMAAMSGRGLALLVSNAEVTEAFRRGTRVKGSYGDHTGLCEFESEVIDSEPPVAANGDRPAKLGVLRLRPPPRIVTTQRRRFIRADVDLTIPASLLDTQSKMWQAAPAEVHNLGGGGLRMLVAPHPSLVAGAKMALALGVPGGDVVTMARVVQVLPPGGTGDPVGGTGDPVGGTGDPVGGTGDPVSGTGDPVGGTGDPVDGAGEAVVVRVAFAGLEGADRDRIERFVYRQLSGMAPAKLWVAGRIGPAAS